MDTRWQHAMVIIERLEQNDHRAYFVGGCVRDLQLQKHITDIDITTSALPEEVTGLFSQVIPTGIDHGTVLVRYNQQSFEITTYRSDKGQLTKEHSKQRTTLIADLAKRDFTINAMAMNQQYELIDPFGGKKDLKAGKIRAVGNPHARFREDPLRMLRAFRFASQLGFVIEPATLDQISHLKKSLQQVAVERLKAECEKFFQGNHLASSMPFFRETGLALMLPVFKTYPELIYKLEKIALSAFVSFADVLALGHYLEPNVSVVTWVKEWKCSKKEKNRAKALSVYLTYYQDHGLDEWLAYIMEPNYTNGFCHLTSLLFPSNQVQGEMIHRKKATIPIQSREDIEINGHMASSLFPDRIRGPWIKHLMEEIEYLIVTRQIENKASLIKEWILCHPPGKN